VGGGGGVVGRLAVGGRGTVPARAGDRLRLGGAISAGVTAAAGYFFGCLPPALVVLGPAQLDA
jgi:hypothetical protein